MSNNKKGCNQEIKRRTYIRRVITLQGAIRKSPTLLSQYRQNEKFHSWPKLISSTVKNIKYVCFLIFQKSQKIQNLEKSHLKPDFLYTITTWICCAVKKRVIIVGIYDSRSIKTILGLHRKETALNNHTSYLKSALTIVLDKLFFVAKMTLLFIV